MSCPVFLSYPIVLPFPSLSFPFIFKAQMHLRTNKYIPLGSGSPETESQFYYTLLYYTILYYTILFTLTLKILKFSFLL